MSNGKDILRKVLLGPQLYQLCKDKKATIEVLDERAALISNKIGKFCSTEDLIQLCEISSTTQECSEFVNDKSIQKFNAFLQSQPDCPICFEELNETARVIGNCGHLFHKNCIQNLIKNKIYKCPVCRALTFDKEDKDFCENFFTTYSFLDGSETYIAAGIGSLRCLKLAHTYGYKWDKNVSAIAAKSGNLDCLRYAHENGCPWDSNTTFHASSYGHIDCLRYAHENGCPWGKETCYGAAEHDQIDCLRYAHENGCPWDSTTTHSAAITASINCLVYAVKNGCLVEERTLVALENMIQKIKKMTTDSIENKKLKLEYIENYQQCLDFLKESGWNKSLFSRKWSYHP